MEYSTALALKEAGFPQLWVRGRWFYLRDGSKILFDEVQFAQEENGTLISYQERLIAIPTLSELIEELGYNFRGLIRDDENKWSCLGVDKVIRFSAAKHPDGTDNRGETPEEALSTLYLSLYGKKD